MRRWTALPIRIAVTLVAVAIAALIGWRLWVYYELSPWTRDARISADVVGVTPDVSGLVSDVRVRVNQAVHSGDVLFLIDRARFDLALRPAQAVVASRLATLQQAERDLTRYSSLTSSEVSRQQVEQAQAAEAVKDEPAPAPSADVPARGQTAETEPTATDTP